MSEVFFIGPPVVRYRQVVLGFLTQHCAFPLTTGDFYLNNLLTTFQALFFKSVLIPMRMVFKIIPQRGEKEAFPHVVTSDDKIYSRIEGDIFLLGEWPVANER